MALLGMPEVTARRAFRRGQGLTGNVAETGQHLVFENVDESPLCGTKSNSNPPATARAVSSRFSRSKRKRNFLGTLTCIGKLPRKLAPEEIRLIQSMCDQIGVAVENIHLFEQVKSKSAELETSNSELREALEQQTATSEKSCASSPARPRILSLCSTPWQRIVRDFARLMTPRFCVSTWMFFGGPLLLDLTRVRTPDR